LSFFGYSFRQKSKHSTLNISTLNTQVFSSSSLASAACGHPITV
jgi:hypothetical protein